MKKSLLMSIVMICVASMAFAGDCGQCTKIVVTGNAEYPPLTWQDKTNQDKLIGFAVELLDMAFSDMKIPVEGRFVGRWARAQDEVKLGNVDMLGGAYITEERKTYMDYILPPFVMDPTVIFVKKGKTFPFQKWEDLIGLTGGAPIGNSYGEKFDTFAEQSLKIERVPKLSQTFEKLLTDRNDYVVYGLYPGLAELETMGIADQVEYLQNSVISEGLYFTFSKQSPCNCPEIKDHLTKKVQEFAEQKLPEQLMEKYLKLWKEQSAGGTQ